MYTLTTAQYNAAISSGFPSSLGKPYAERPLDGFIIRTVPFLKNYGYFTDVIVNNYNYTLNAEAYEKFNNFCNIMGIKENISVLSKFSHAFYNEISDHTCSRFIHGFMQCVREMLAMADVLLGRAIINYNGYGTTFSAQFDGEEMFSDVSRKTWSQWPLISVKNCIENAISTEGDTHKLCFAYGLGFLRTYEQFALNGHRVSELPQNINFISFGEGNRNPIPGETKIIIEKDYFSNRN